MNIKSDTSIGEEEGINLKQLFAKLMGRWPWVLLSLAICLGSAYLYLRYQTPMYKISARVLVNDQKKGAGMLGSDDLLGDLGGLLGSKSTVDNEAEILKTHYLLEKVVKDMDLNITYFRKGRVKDVELYESPFKVTLITPADTIRSTKFGLNLMKNNRLGIVSKDRDTTVSFDKVITLPNVGSFIVSRVAGVPFTETEFSCTITSVDEKVATLADAMTIEVPNKLVTIIDLNLNYPIPRKGEDILNKLIQKYVEGNLNDKNEVADSTIKFIKNRLAYIGGELGDLEGNIQGFKQKINLQI